ncbi:hypothetical protein [Patulibacter minatonensis]|uniref:hypothetical protein n=1 Tax=Patulibacter minatonensis TaxID=298163 RepID=UPI00047E2D29|nr:hypothetical protein [Patulibacter minatonensis]
MPFALIISLVLLVTLPVALWVMRGRIRRLVATDRSRIGHYVNDTGVDRRTRAVHSVQSASIITPTERLDASWDVRHLERLASLYWLYMEKTSLGLIRVVVEGGGRYVCFLSPRIKLLGFREPEFLVDADSGTVRWPIDRGLLISRRGRGRGVLELEVRRDDDRGGEADGTPMSHARMQLEVRDFHPTMSSGLAGFVYRQTQSRYHVLLAFGFIHSLASADLDRAGVGRFGRLLRLGKHEPRERMRPTGS